MLGAEDAFRGALAAFYYYSLSQYYCDSFPADRSAAKRLGAELSFVFASEPRAHHETQKPLASPALPGVNKSDAMASHALNESIAATKKGTRRSKRIAQYKGTCLPQLPVVYYRYILDCAVQVVVIVVSTGTIMTTVVNNCLLLSLEPASFVGC